MDLKEQILNLLLKENTLHLRKLARLTKKHPNTVKSLVVSLEKENILTVEKDEKLIISFSRSKQSKLLKTYLLQKKVYNSGLIKYLNDSLFEPTIILFGSCAKGEMVSRSDIDLCLICDEIKKIDIIEYEQILERDVQLFIHTKDSFRKLSEELKNNILNGIILEGYIEAFNEI